MTLIDPLLSPRCGIYNVFVADAEDGEVLLLEVGGDAFDVAKFAIEILELVENLLIPESFFLEIADKLPVKDGEVSAEVTLHVEVLIVRLDAWGGAHDVADGGGGSNGEDVGVAHAVLGNLLAERRGQETKEGVRRLFLLLIMTTHAPSHGRSPRIEFPGAIYYVLSRGNRWTNLFTDDDDR